MFDRYNDTVQYIAKSSENDLFNGKKEAAAVTLNMRYVGGASVAVQGSNSRGVEDRLVFHSPVEVLEGNKLVYNNRKMNIKKVEDVRDVFGNTIFYRLEVL